MNAIDIAVISVVCIAVIGVIDKLVYRKIKGKGGCCDCSSCGANCPHCKSKKDTDN